LIILYPELRSNFEQAENQDGDNNSFATNDDKISDFGNFEHDEDDDDDDDDDNEESGESSRNPTPATTPDEQSQRLRKGNIDSLSK